MNISSKLWSQCHDIYYISDCSNLEHRVPFPQISKTGDLLSLDPNSAEKDTSMFQCSLTQCSVQFSCSVMSDSLQPHGLHHTRLPCPSPTSRAYLNSYPLSRWCHPTILSSLVPFSTCLQSFPASGSFPMSQFFPSGGQSVGASASVLPMTIQDWFPLELTGWISLQSKGLSRVFSNTTVQKYQFFSAQLSLWSNSHIHTWPLEKP